MAGDSRTSFLVHSEDLSCRCLQPFIPTKQPPGDMYQPGASCMFASGQEAARLVFSFARSFVYNGFVVPEVDLLAFKRQMSFTECYVLFFFNILASIQRS